MVKPDAMKTRTRLGMVLPIVITGMSILGVTAWTQNLNPTSGPDPKEIPGLSGFGQAATLNQARARAYPQCP